ncbi:contact-dependent growth inhibition system immunity protein [Pseudomonas frederiksbergensis]|uniref:contact-dependent growth inhibition system immunity protein n=1 Tax=Pseudomonas frederiksbergensis TaxID=104087 RepID=UPI003CFECD91
MKQDFEELFQFFGCYFHLDWMCMHKTADDVIQSFFMESYVDSILEVQAQMMGILSSDKNEVELRQFLLSDMCCSYCYWFEWPSGESWLLHLLDLFDRQLLSLKPNR